MTDKPAVSVVMPAYNAGQYIGESIASVIAQTYSCWELIVVDDGSTDNTKAITDGYAAKDERIRYVYQANGRQGKARNTGIQHAISGLIAFLDADDLWVPEMLEEQVKLMLESHADLVFGYIHYLDPGGAYQVSSGVPEYDYLEGKEGFTRLLRLNYIPIFTVVASKQSIEKAGGFKESADLQFGEDFDLWLRMLLHGARFELNRKYLAYYRLHAQQSIRNSGSKYFQVLELIRGLPDIAEISGEKRKACCMWIRRGLVNQKDIGVSDIRKLSSYLPSALPRALSISLGYVLPRGLLRKIVYQLSYYSW